LTNSTDYRFSASAKIKV